MFKIIIKSILFCGKQNIALRIKSGYLNLKSQLENAGHNATYISKPTQNDLIEYCGRNIVNNIISEVKKSVFYSILFDETTDISRKSQLTLELRYITNEGIVQEDFVGFADLHAQIYSHSDSEPILTGEKIGQAVLSFLKELTLDLSKCVAIGTDGCSVMRSVRCGAVAHIKKSATHAVWASCYNHNLNLSISKCANVRAIQNSFAAISEVCTFLRSSYKRNFVLQYLLGKSLPTLCQTRWVERHDTVLAFCDNKKRKCRGS